MSYFSGSQVDF